MTDKKKLLFGCIIIPVGIFVILSLWVALSVHGAHERIAKGADCRRGMTGFIMGLRAYQIEYGHFPTEALTSTDPKVPSITRGKIISTLHPDQKADPTESNPRRINFFDPPPAKNQRSGLYMDEHNEPIFVDPWGTPYRFNFDQSGEGKIPNPDPSDNKEHPFVEKTVIMFSAGPDRNPDTWEDNLLSWK